MLKNKLCVAVHFVWATWDRQPLIMEEIEQRLWRCIGAVCADDKCEVLAIGGMQIDTVVSYIASQKQHHAGGTLWPDTEEPGQSYL